MVFDILVIGVYFDDIEFGCGGSLVKLVCVGVCIYVLVFSCGGCGCYVGIDRGDELYCVLWCLGVVEVIQWDFLDICFFVCCNDIVVVIEQVCVQIILYCVYMMCGEDYYQDYCIVYEVLIIVCCSILQIFCYESFSMLLQFVLQVFEDISVQLDLKIYVLCEYVSQGDCYYMQEDYLCCYVQFRGQQIGIGFSEGFVFYWLVL